MSAMKEKVIELREAAEQKLIELGVDRQLLLEMEEKLGEQVENWEEILELLAGYEMFIQIAARETIYSKEDLWSIWGKQVEELNMGISAGETLETLEEMWKDFKEVTMEEDW